MFSNDFPASNQLLLSPLTFLQHFRIPFHTALNAGFSQLPCEVRRASINHPDQTGEGVVPEKEQIT